jgi:alkanesulfonate monooxygenase SsuD/methylene tetrahydromethanopterin reductase-like flavin-dependent oxidoreductase (luciferase family)
VKFGVSYNTAYDGMDPGAMIAVARHAEDCGFESFYLPEHIALYPGAAPSRPTCPSRTRSCRPSPTGSASAKVSR